MKLKLNSTSKECQCIEFYLYLDICSPNGTYLCRNGGVCKYDHLKDEAHCACPYSYEGKYCEIGKEQVQFKHFCLSFIFVTFNWI